MRINGRLLRASTLAERRVLKTLGVDALRVPRSHNPYQVARRLTRLARGGEDLAFLRGLVPHRPHAVPAPSPEPDHDEGEHRDAAE